MTASVDVASCETESWVDLIECSWPAVTASDLLRGNEEIWRHDGLNVPSQEEAVALATMGRLVRFGQSIQLSLPIGQGSTLSQVAFYLHRLRLDAAGGLLRSSWFNRMSMERRTDLLVFGRHRNMLRSFSTSAVMRPQLVGGSVAVESSDLQRTLLINGQRDLLEMLELLGKKAKPFAIIVDASPNGCETNAISLTKVLPEYFKSVPIVMLNYTGQAIAESVSMHAWNTRLSDVARLRGNKCPSGYFETVEVVAAADPIMNAFVSKTGFMVWNLKRKLEDIGGVSQEFQALLAVDRVLRGLNVPLSVHEAGMLRHARGGRFAIRTIESWMEIAARLQGRRGDIQDLHNQIIATVRRMTSDLREAIPGRSQVIVKFCAESIANRQKISIMVGNKREAEILVDYLETRLGVEVTHWLTVSAMDGASAFAPQGQDLVVYASMLYPSRIHWLGLQARRKLVLCHPFERERLQSQVAKWWAEHATPSASKGDKYALWGFQWPAQRFLRDEVTWDLRAPSDQIKYRELDFNGIYPVKPRVAHLDARRGYDDWLDALMQEPASIESVDDRPLELTRNVVVVQFEGQTEPVRCSANQVVMRLRVDELDRCAAHELCVGDEVLMLEISNERIATQNDLFEMFVENNHGLQQTLRISNKWQNYVDEGLKNFEGSVSELNKYFKSKRVNVHNSTVQNWVHGGVIGPQDKSAIFVLAELTQVTNPKQMAEMVDRAIAVIRAEHRRIGSDLRRAISVSRARDISGVQIGSRRFSRDVFDALVQVATVSSIEQPPHEKVNVDPRTIRDVALEFAMLHPRKVLFVNIGRNFPKTVEVKFPTLFLR